MLSSWSRRVRGCRRWLVADAAPPVCSPHLHTMRPAAAADSRTKLNAWWAKSDIVYGTHAAVLAAADAIANKNGLSDVLPLVDKAVSEADSRSIRYHPAALQHQ